MLEIKNTLTERGSPPFSYFVLRKNLLVKTMGPVIAHLVHFIFQFDF
jgi:hypothetical protein